MFLLSNKSAQSHLEKLEVDTGQDTLIKASEVLEETLGGVEVTVAATVAVVTDGGLDRLALVRQLNLLVAGAVATVLSDSDNKVTVVGGRATASRVVEHVASVPGKLATTALLEVVLSSVAGLQLVRAKGGLSRDQASNGQSSSENSSELHFLKVKGFRLVFMFLSVKRRHDQSCFLGGEGGRAL